MKPTTPLFATGACLILALTACRNERYDCENRELIEPAIIHFQSDQDMFFRLPLNTGLIGESMTLFQDRNYNSIRGDATISGADSISENNRSIYFTTPGIKTVQVAIDNCIYQNSYTNYLYDDAPIDQCPCLEEESNGSIEVKVLEKQSITIDSIRVLIGTFALDQVNPLFLALNQSLFSPSLEAKQNGYETWIIGHTFETVPEFQSLFVGLYPTPNAAQFDVAQNRLRVCLLEPAELDNWREGSHLLEDCGLEIFLSR